MAERIDDFLNQRRIAVVGVSRHPTDMSRLIFDTLREQGYDVVPVHPGVREIAGLPAVARVQDVEPPPQGVMVLTPPHVTGQVMRDCVQASVSRVWLHRGAGTGAVSDEALAIADEHDLAVIPGECALMFVKRSGAVHHLHGALRQVSGTYPTRRAAGQPSPGLVQALGGLQLFVGLGGILGGIALPGLVLLGVNGLLQALGGAASLRRWRGAPEAGLALGALLMAGTVVQAAILGVVHPLHVALVVAGVAEALLAWRWRTIRDGRADQTLKARSRALDHGDASVARHA